MKPGTKSMTLSLLLLAVILTACNSGNNSSTPLYSLSGTVSGQVGSLVLQNNGGDDLTISADGIFFFATYLLDSSAYVVSVQTQPAGQTCTLTNANGTISGAAVTNVAVNCVFNYSIGGSVSGLTGSLLLQNNGADDLTISANGAFAFATPLPDTSAYVISVLTQPAGQTCSLISGSSMLSGAAVTNVGVSCVPNSFQLQLGLNTVGANASMYDYGSSLVLDAQGNTYVAAETTGSLGEASAGGRDIVLVKVNSSGTLQWVKQYGNITMGANASGTERVVAVTIDSNGDIIIIGTTSGNLGEANAGSTDAYVLKASSTDGSVIWITQFGNVSVGAGASATENVKGVDVDSSDNIYISGRTSGNLGEASAGSTDFFGAKLDSNGNIFWITQLGNVTVGAAASGTETTYGGLVVDSSGNSYITGNTNGDLAEVNLDTGNSYDFVVYKLDTTGMLQWITQLGSVTGGAGSGFNDYDDGIDVDASGNIYAVGQTFSALGEANAGANDGFIFKLNASGALQWIKQFGNVTVGAGASLADEFFAVKVGSDNNVHIVGRTTGDFAETNANPGTMDVIVLKMDPLGNTIFAKQLGNVTIGPAAAGADQSSQNGLVVDSSNHFYIAGATNGDLFETNAGSNDIFIFKLNENGDF